jgi:hypothetical protein
MKQKSRTAFLLATVMLLIAIMVFVKSTSHEKQFMSIPLYAAEAQTSALTDSVAATAWLHVEVETSWGWFWQKSKGLAYVIKEKNSQQRVKVGKLCLRLEAHGWHEECHDNADSIVVIEKKRGVAIPKRIARVTAWTENPKLGPTTTSLEP